LPGIEARSLCVQQWRHCGLNRERQAYVRRFAAGRSNPPAALVPVAATTAMEFLPGASSIAHRQSSRQLGHERSECDGLGFTDELKQ